MEIKYNLEESVLYTAQDWEMIRKERARNPHNPDVTDEALWMEEINQYRCALQATMFDYIEEHWEGGVRSLPGADFWDTSLLSIRHIISDELWEQWLVLGAYPTQNVFLTDIVSMDDFNAETYNPNFRDMVHM